MIQIPQIKTTGARAMTNHFRSCTARCVPVIAVVSLVVAALAVASRPSLADEPAKPNAAAKGTTNKDGAALPVILLTGFEPFGPGRPANPSWESIKSLDGQTWRGYQLICKQLPCVWGQPLEKLEAHIATYKPVAIFSFGQGAPGAFAIETRAANRRGNFPDNDGQRPPRPAIIENGPAEVKATIDAEKLQTLLAEQKHAVRVSTNAGAYLCEETLYTLEHLKKQHPAISQVMFCHVPPLDGKQVTPEFVRKFVLDVLAAWQKTYATSATTRGTEVVPASAEEAVQGAATDATSPKPAASKPVKEDARTAEVKKFIDRYFRTWSNREMDAYGEGFLREAVVQFIDDRGQVSTQATPEFLADQRRFQSLRPAKEFPLAADVRFEGPLARAVVHWRLEDGTNPARFGYDHFTLLRRDGQWRILNLVFYGSDPPKTTK